jgi:RNA polymerase sigma-70 factor (ECF subfamily)
LSEGPSSPPNPPSSPCHAELLALADELRPELHRYCARLMGSVIEGEDVVQDTFVRAFVAVDELEEMAPLRAMGRSRRRAFATRPSTAGRAFHSSRRHRP